MTKEKVYLIVALTSLLLAIGAGGYSYERYVSAQESKIVSDNQYAEAQEIRDQDTERYLELMDYSTDNMRIYNEDMLQVKLGAGIALILFLDGFFFIAKSRREGQANLG